MMPRRRRGEVVAEPPPHREADDDVEPRRLDLGRAAQRLGREEAFAVEHAAARERGVHARERARGEAAVDRGDRAVEHVGRRVAAGRTPGTMNVSIAGRSHASRAARTREALDAFGVAERHESSATRSRWSGGAPIDMPSRPSGFTISVSTASCTGMPVTRRITSPTRKP